jgi:hypothetical protein
MGMWVTRKPPGLPRLPTCKAQLPDFSRSADSATIRIRL